MHEFKFKRDADVVEEAGGAGIDWPQTFVALSVVGVAAWGLWFFLRDRGDASPEPSPATPPAPGTIPRVPTIPTIPTISADPASLHPGDLVFASTALVGKQLGVAPSGPNSGVVRMRITIVEQGQVLAVSADPAFPSGAPVVLQASDVLGHADGPAPNANVPAVIPAAPPPPSGPPVFMVGDPLPLVNGHHYRAKLKLSGLEAGFATKGLIAAKFASGGFTDVRVYQTSSELPAGWPAETAQGGAGIWWVEGVWGGATGPEKREPQVLQVWEG